MTESRREAKREYMRRWRQENPDVERERQQRSYQKHAEARRAYARNYQRNADPELMRQRKRRWARENPGKARESGRRWAQKNPETVRAIGRRHYHANADAQRERARQWRQENPELLREIKRRWDQANAAKIREYARQRRAVKQAALIADITPEQWAAWSAYWGDRCWLQIPGICQGVADSIDHVIPLARGGPHCLANLRPACRRCNSSKSDSDWRGYLAGKRTAA